ncbi:DUF6443 domain-containing protein [uncultured Winogradskyella sp.]|uniref:DUF6443 domain-containing protein n=1 Tax=uncultured Winogradskyella sp. TaxID=395353 RepID=UPI00262561F3|nr:DUF6443 domain-containing protein [uncultured Winogradskyella sp.]
MRKLIYTIALCVVSNLVLAQTPEKNYVKSTSYQVKTTDGAHNAGTTTALTPDDKIESVTYFDGLGRPVQSIARQAGGQKQDIITPMVYDAFGRQLKDYLPYARSTTSLDYELPAQLMIDLEAQYMARYADDLNPALPNPYSEKVLEASPMGRVLEQAAPGNDWAVNNGHTIKFGYDTNSFDANNPDDSNNDNVIYFDVAHPNGDTEQTELVYKGYYAANRLYKTITKDENWTAGKDHTTEEFKNKQGQVLLKRTYNNEVAHDTYYVYDDYGNLTYVLPPEASQQILTLDELGRAASQTNYPWVDMALVDSNFADEYNDQLQSYDNADILNVNITNPCGGQGGFTVTTLEDSQEVLLSINFSAAQELELKTGKLVSLDAYGNFGDTELGRITGQDYDYVFYITKNEIHISGGGKLYGINQLFNSSAKLTYDENFLWTKLADVDSKFASGFEKDVEIHAQNTNQNPLNVYLSNPYGGQGGLHVTVDDNDNITLSFNMSSTTDLKLKQGVILNLDAKRALANRRLGTLSGSDHSYDFHLVDNNIVVTGSGVGQTFNGSMFPNPTTPDDTIIVTEVIEGLCYIYHYDKRNRLIEKKIPGKGWEHIVYDKLDRPILTQDARQRLDHKWLFTKYDVYGRVVYTGKHLYTPQGSTHNAARLELQADLNAQTILHETRTSTGTSLDSATLYYSNQTLPNTGLELLTINYYDSYNNLGLSAPLLKAHGNMVYDAAIDTNVKSMATCSQVRVLDTNDWITAVTYYDDKAMPIYVASTNTYLNTTDVVTTDYDFVGKVLSTESTHTKDGGTPLIVEDTFSYDHASRLLTQSQSINGSTPELIVNNHYDNFGQLHSKAVGGAVASDPTQSTGLQTVDYSYNIRGWLKAINDVDALGSDLFGFTINYNAPETSNSALYNGNISETFWKTAYDGHKRGYDYSYDALNRIETANYQGNYVLTGTTNDIENYSLIGANNTPGVAYDKNGNITSLRRMGLVEANTTVAAIDVLSYGYAPFSNTLLNVADNGHDDGFKDGDNTAENDYLYDVNGNMIQDLNKNIVNIEYNHLNLPTKVTFGMGNALGSDMINYVYDATGVKLKKLVVDMSENNGINSQSTSTTLYAGGYIYEKSGGYSHDGQFWQGAEVDHGLKMFAQPEGYIEPANNGSGNYNYVYQYKDHLGNIRLTYTDNNGSLEVIEENNYYPFGLEHKGYNNVVSANSNSVASKYKYNGKELNDELGLDWYDFGARNYDASLGRWMNLDPLANKYYSLSPYNAFANSPLSFVDPDGRELVLAGNRKHRRKTMRRLRKLTNDRLKVNRKTGKVSIASRGTRNRGKKLTKGTGLISGLVNSGNTATVTTYADEFGKSNIFQEKSSSDSINELMLGTGDHTVTYASEENQSNGAGGDAIVLLDHSDNGENIVNADGTTGAPREILIGHELLHALNILSGNVDTGDANDDLQDPDTLQEGVLSPEEVSIRESENEIRDEQKVVRRASPIDNMLKNLEEFLKNNK